MKKRLLFFVAVMFIGLVGCHLNQSPNEKIAQPKPAQPQATAVQKPTSNPEHIVQLTFVKYLDDGDFTQILVSKGDSTFTFINDADTSRNLNRGDVIQVTWKQGTITIPGDNDAEMPAKLLLAVKKIEDGPVTKFRKAYNRKLKYTWATDEEFTSSYLDKAYLLAEYYLTQTKNPLLKLAIDKREEISYSIESKERDGRAYKMIGIGPIGPNGRNIVQWIYIDEESEQIYEYDLAEDKLKIVN